MYRIKKHKNFIKYITSANRKQRQNSIKEASKAEICSICEIVKNIVHNKHLNLKLSPKQKRELFAHKKEIKNLIDKHIPLTRKRRILQKGAGFFLPLILSLAGPILGKLLAT